jgi:hypothetical protein
MSKKNGAISFYIYEVSFSEKELVVTTKVKNTLSTSIWVLNDYEDNNIPSPICVTNEDGIFITPSVGAAGMLIHSGYHVSKYLYIKPGNTKVIKFFWPIKKNENGICIRCGTPYCVDINKINSLSVKTEYLKSIPRNDCVLKEDKVVIESKTNNLIIPASCGRKTYLISTDEFELRKD